MKTTGVGGRRGFDSGKKVKGRKRHLLVDTEGWCCAPSSIPPNIMDRDGVKLVLHESITDRVSAAAACLARQRATTARGKGKDWIEQTLGWTRRDRGASTAALQSLGLR